MNNENNNQNQYYVYIHVDKLTGLVLYCGKGTKSIHTVKSGKYKGQKHLYDRAYSNCDRPYKIDDTIEVFKVKYFDNEDEAFKYEEFLTNWYKLQGQCWYNDSIGTKHSEEARKKISEANRGKCRSEEVKKKISETKTGKYTGELNHMYGKHHTEEAKKKMSEANKGKKTIILKDI